VLPVTVLRQLELAGMACARFHDEKVRGVKAARASLLKEAGKPRLRLRPSYDVPQLREIHGTTA
jgi:hypothetical protein